MASSQHPPKTPPSTLPKRTFPSFSVRRPSASSTTLQASASSSTLNLSRTSFSTTSTTAAVAASPTSPATSNQTAGSGIPVHFRSLRNLFSFNGSTKPPHNVQNTSSRSFSVGFRSVRQSMNISREKEKEKEKDRNRKFSLSNEALMAPVISIEPRRSAGIDQSQTHISGDESPSLRRSVSLSRLEGVVNLEKPLLEPVQSGLSLRD